MNNYVKVQNKNGEHQDVVNLAPGLEGELAIVYLETLRRLTKNLSATNFRAVKAAMLDMIRECGALEEMCAVMENELKFHKTVNLINTITKEDVDASDTSLSHPLVVGKIDLDGNSFEGDIAPRITGKV
jgi:hypothetical protein